MVVFYNLGDDCKKYKDICMAKEKDVLIYRNID